MSDCNIIEDHISFQLTVDQIVTSDTVKIIAEVDGLILESRGDHDIQVDIVSMLKKFIDTKWNFSNVRRSTDSTGVERISLRATARVDESENYNIENRAAAVSRAGLRISDIEVDVTIPQDKIDASQRALRVQLLRQANEEAAAMSIALGRTLRVGNVNFQASASAVSSFVNTYVTMAAPKGPTGATGPTGPTGDDGISNSQKITVTASVNLSSVAFPDDFR